ncbi:porin [Methyloraptor flagellatus]|uniref:Porin n=1 Tax=Methyloraptor flagellatus TaxID=3162530 RepID=A0AAU7XEZ4_9HYPH
MKMKLAMAAALVAGAASTAEAADLGRPAPAAVDYVKVCDAYGAGFFYIPGSDTCLKIGGYVRARFFAGDDNSKNFYGAPGVTFVPAPFGLGGGRGRDNFASQTEVSVTFDARTNTEFGLLRSFVDARWDVNTRTGTVSYVDKAYVQFGGLTAGYAQSFFDFFTGYSFGVREPHWSDHTTNLLAYTFAFGNGISASIAVEDPTVSGTTAAVRQVGPLFTGVAPYATASQVYATPVYGGLKSPDFVGNIRVDQAWGSAQIMGAAHENYDNTAGGYGSKWGWAVGAGVKVNLPMLGAGDQLALQGAYGEGSNFYISNALSYADYFAATNIIGGARSIAQTKAWQISGGWHHVFTRQFAFDIDASYLNVDAAGPNDFRSWRLASDLVWTPVTNLDIGVGLEYQSIDYTTATRNAYAASVGGPAGTALGNSNSWLGILHVKRSF